MNPAEGPEQAGGGGDARFFVPGIAPEDQAALNALGARYAAAFASQFAAEPLAVRFHFNASRFLRRVVADYFWPGPDFSAPLLNLRRPVLIDAPELLRDPEIAELFGAVERDPARPAFKFPSAFEPLGFLAGLLVGLQAHPPRLAEPTETRTLAIPSRIAELLPLWRAGGRTRRLADFADALRREPPPAGVTLLLFGSLAAPPPWPAYADADLAVYLDTRARADVLGLLNFITRFRRLARLLLAVDPVQHHGPYLLLESDLPVYPESLLPLETLHRATTLTDTPLTLNVAPIPEDRIFSLEALAAAWRGLRHLAGAAPRAFQDRYTGKTYSSLALLVPALACACLGRPAEKAASFDVFKNEMDAESVAAIAEFERLRREWRWTLAPPAPLLGLAGARAHWLARTINRWPCRPLGEALAKLAPRIDPLFHAILERLRREAKS